MRNAWLGIAVLLAYLPDILEMSVAVVGLAVPRSALASLPAAVVEAALVVALLRWAVRETSPIALAAAAAAVVSHAVLDLIAGGIPLGWPFSSHVVGPDWVRVDQLPPLARLPRELMIVGPVLAAGLAVYAVRCAGLRSSAVAAALLAAATAATSVVTRAAASTTVIAATVCALLLAELALVALTTAWRPRLAALWNGVVLAPILLVGGVTIYAWYEVDVGDTYWERHEYAEALVHYNRGRAAPLLGGQAHLRVYRRADCLRHLGHFGEAYELFEAGSRRFPDCLWFQCGIIDLLLSADNPQWHRPAEALALARSTAPRATGTVYESWALALLARAEIAARPTDVSPGAPTAQPSTSRPIDTAASQRPQPPSL